MIEMRRKKGISNNDAKEKKIRHSMIGSNNDAVKEMISKENTTSSEFMNILGNLYLHLYLTNQNEGTEKWI